VARCESHSHGAAKRQAHDDSHCAFSRAGRGTSPHPEGADTDDGFCRRVHGPSSCSVSSGATSIFRRWWSMSFARSSCSKLATAKRRPLANPFHSICDSPRSCGTGGCQVPTLTMRTGFLPALTVEGNCCTGQVRFTRCTRNLRQMKSESWAGWHTFRHTYATLPKGNDEDLKVVQEVMT
jgi:hypothetical protein